MVSIRHIHVPNRVACITGDFRPNFEDDSWREITGAMFASEPIGRKRDLLIQRLFETELTARRFAEATTFFVKSYPPRVSLVPLLNVLLICA